MLSPARPEEGIQQKSVRTDALDSARKVTGEESDASSVPASNGMNVARHDKEKGLLPMIHEEDSSHNDAVVEPTIAEDSIAKSVAFKD